MARRIDPFFRNPSVFMEICKSGIWYTSPFEFYDCVSLSVIHATALRGLTKSIRIHKIVEFFLKNV
jgi:hypothetical protein